MTWAFWHRSPMAWAISVVMEVYSLPWSPSTGSTTTWVFSPDSRSTASMAWWIWAALAMYPV